jgi:membrane protein
MRFLRNLVRASMEHRLQDLAAAMAFWALLALFPFCIFLLTIIGFIPLKGMEKELLGLLHQVMPGEAAALFDRTVREIVHRQHGLLLVGSLLASLWSASGGIGSLEQGLNRAWNVHETRPWWQERLRSLAVVVIGTAMIIVALAGLLLAPSALARVYDFFEVGRFSLEVWAVVRWPLVIATSLAMLGGLYHFLPNTRQPFRLFTPGAAVALGTWLLTSLLFRTYVAHFNAYAKSYGTLGAAIVLLMWLYLSSATIILGAEVNACLARRAASPAPS